MAEYARKLIAENKKTKDPYLDVGKCGLTDENFPHGELAELVHLERLVLANEWHIYSLEKLEHEFMQSKNKGKSNSLNSLPKSITKKLFNENEVRPC